MSASHLGVVVLKAHHADAIALLADEWLDANLTAHVISMQLTAGDSGTGEALHLLIVYEAERRVRRE